MAIGDLFQPRGNEHSFSLKLPTKEEKIHFGTDSFGRPITITYRTFDIKGALDSGIFKPHLNPSVLEDKIRILEALLNNRNAFGQSFNQPPTASRQPLFETFQPTQTYPEEPASQRGKTLSSQTREEPPAELSEQPQTLPDSSERSSEEQRSGLTTQEERPSRVQEDARQQAVAPQPGDAEDAAPSPATGGRPAQIQGRQIPEPASSSSTLPQTSLPQSPQSRSAAQQSSDGATTSGQTKSSSSFAQPSMTSGQSSSSEVRAQQRTSLQPFLQRPQTQSFLGSWGFSNPQQIQQLIYQVRLLFLLFDQTAQQGSSPSMMQSITTLHSLLQMSQQLASLQDQMKQILAEQGVLAGDGAHELNALLQSLSQQLDEHEALLQQAKPQTESNLAAGKLPGNPMTAALMLKERCNQLLLQAKDAAQAKVDSTLTEKESALARSSAGKEGQAPAAPTLEKATPPLALSQPKAAPTTPGMKEVATNVQRQPLEVRNKLELRNLPLNIQHNGIKPPILVSLAYPIEHKIQTPTKTSSASKGKASEKEEEQTEGSSGNAHHQQMVFIPEGPMILGDPFSQGSNGESSPQVVHVPAFLIAASCVTNGQFADWLNEAFAAKKIRLGEKGLILDNQNNVICATQVSSNSSQIHIRVDKGVITFDVLPGGELNPIVQVSWYGAQAYCADYGLRLPNEAEWEKAAGMQPQSKDTPLVKFRFGVGKNEIDPTWANYSSDLNRKTERFPRQITFYNGKTQFSIQGKTYTTQDACSPYGCYDMCGNVRQWISDGETDKIAKGGSYLTPEKELEVAARAHFDPSACMSDIGFRVAIDA